MTVEQDKQNSKQLSSSLRSTSGSKLPAKRYLKVTNKEPGDLQTLYLKAMMSLQKHCQQVMDKLPQVLFYHSRLEEERGRGFHILWVSRAMKI